MARSTVQAEGWMCHISMFRVDTAEDSSSILQDDASAAASPSPVSPDGVDRSTDSSTPLKSPASSSLGSPNQSTPVLGSNVTNELMGTTFVQALKPSINGRPALVFAFIDVASKIEGMLCLRYQVFDLFNSVEGFGIPSPTAPKPIIAECIGGAFRVYNSKTFPGLMEVTPLTKASPRVPVMNAFECSSNAQSLEDVGVFTGKRAAVRKRQQNKPNGSAS